MTYPLESFTVFQSLPTELRLKVWSHAQIPRVLHIHIITRFRWTTTSPPPAILSVNHESREHALGSYHVFNDITPLGKIPMYYFNPEVDIFFVDFDSLSGVRATDFLRLVRSQFQNEIPGKDIRVRHLAFRYSELIFMGRAREHGMAFPNQTKQKENMQLFADLENIFVIQEVEGDEEVRWLLGDGLGLRDCNRPEEDERIGLCNIFQTMSEGRFVEGLKELDGRNGFRTPRVRVVSRRYLLEEGIEML